MEESQQKDKMKILRNAFHWKIVVIFVYAFTRRNGQQ